MKKAQNAPNSRLSHARIIHEAIELTGEPHRAAPFRLTGRWRQVYSHLAKGAYGGRCAHPCGIGALRSLFSSPCVYRMRGASASGSLSEAAKLAPRFLLSFMDDAKRVKAAPKGALRTGKTMYAVIRTGGKQYRVAANDIVEIEKVAGEPGDKIAFDEVLMVGGEGETKIGSPLLKGASVEAELVKQARARKIIVFKKKRRKNYRRKKGHRQHFSRVKILAIKA
jgi:large subunit ribosomal protein L21